MDSFLPIFVAVLSGLGVEIVRQFFLRSKTTADKEQVMVGTASQAALQWKEIAVNTIEENKAREKQIEDLELKLARHGYAIRILLETVQDQNVRDHVRKILSGEENGFSTLYSGGK